MEQHITCNITIYTKSNISLYRVFRYPDNEDIYNILFRLYMFLRNKGVIEYYIEYIGHIGYNRYYLLVPNRLHNPNSHLLCKRLHRLLHNIFSHLHTQEKGSFKDLNSSSS